MTTSKEIFIEVGIQEDAPSLPKFFNRLPKLRHSYVDYHSLVAKIFDDNPELENKILEEVNKGIFSKRSDGGHKLAHLLCRNISNIKIRKEQEIYDQRLKKGKNVKSYVQNSFKNNIEQYLEKYSK